MHVKLLTAGGFLAFFAFGFIDNLKGALLPELLRAEQMSYSQGGTVLLAGYFGFIVATLLTGVLADLVSNRSVLRWAGVCLIVGMIGLNVTSAYWQLILSMIVIGLGLGAIEVGGNGLMVELHSVSRARYLNLLATFHSSGSLLVPLVAAWMIGLEFTWQRIYLCSGGLALLLFVVFAISHREVETVSLPQRGWDWGGVLRHGFTPQMGWFYLLIAAYVAIELGVAAWVVEYLQKVQGLSVAKSSFYLSGFFLLIMLGRFVGSWWVEPIGYFRMIAIALSGTLLCLAVGIWGPAYCTFLIPISGVFMSIVFPTVAAAVSSLHRAHLGSIFGILFTFGGVGGALGPWTIGIVSEAYGLRVGIASTMGFCLIALVALGMVTRFPHGEAANPPNQ